MGYPPTPQALGVLHPNATHLLLQRAFQSTIAIGLLWAGTARIMQVFTCPYALVGFIRSYNLCNLLHDATRVLWSAIWADPARGGFSDTALGWMSLG